MRMEASEPTESSCTSILFHNQRGFAYTSCVQNVFVPCKKTFAANCWTNNLLYREHRAQTEQPFQENTYLLITRQFTHTNNHHSDLPRNWSCSSISQHRGNMQILSWTHDLLVTSFLLCCIPSPAALFPLLHFLARIIFLILLLLDGFIFAHIQGMLSIMTFSLAVSERWQENKKIK